MFTGIIKKVLKVVEVSRKGGSFFVWIAKPKAWPFGRLRVGGSIAVNGVCSTVRSVKSTKFEVEYMPETLKKITAGSFKKGTLVNLERSLRLNDLVDGHLVLGHVDCVGKVVEIKKVKQSKIIKISVLPKFMKFIAPKGSIAIDGISLTVVDTGKNWFTVSLVSYTLENTTLKFLKIGDGVNIETDVIAKYVVNYLQRK